MQSNLVKAQAGANKKVGSRVSDCNVLLKSHVVSVELGSEVHEKVCPQQLSHILLNII